MKRVAHCLVLGLLVASVSGQVYRGPNYQSIVNSVLQSLPAKPTLQYGTPTSNRGTQTFSNNRNNFNNKQNPFLIVVPNQQDVTPLRIPSRTYGVPSVPLRKPSSQYGVPTPNRLPTRLPNSGYNAPPNRVQQTFQTVPLVQPPQQPNRAYGIPNRGNSFLSIATPNRGYGTPNSAPSTGFNFRPLKPPVVFQTQVTAPAPVPAPVPVAPNRGYGVPSSGINAPRPGFNSGFTLPNAGPALGLNVGVQVQQRPVTPGNKYGTPSSGAGQVFNRQPQTFNTFAVPSGPAPVAPSNGYGVPIRRPTFATARPGIQSLSLKPADSYGPPPIIPPQRFASKVPVAPQNVYGPPPAPPSEYGPPPAPPSEYGPPPAPPSEYGPPPAPPSVYGPPPAPPSEYGPPPAPPSEYGPPPAPPSEYGPPPAPPSEYGPPPAPPSEYGPPPAPKREYGPPPVPQPEYGPPPPPQIQYGAPSRLSPSALINSFKGRFGNVFT